jgi:hypothetical protein
MRVARVLVPIAVAGTLLAGCGGQTDTGSPAPSAAATSTASSDNGIAALTPDEILTKATAALEKAGSFQMKGEMEENGDTMSVDLKFQGDDLSGTIGMAGSSIQLLKVGGQGYFKADSNFWKKNGGPQGESIAQKIGGRWVKVKPDDESFGELFSTFEVKKLLKADGTVTKGEPKTTDAGPAIALIDSSDQSTLSIATAGEPYPLLMEGPDKKGQIVFSGFGSSFEAKAPAESQVIDMSKIMSGS